MAHKYKAQKVERDGYWFSSKLEAAVYSTLKMMERGGKLKDLKCQVTVNFRTYDHGKVRMIPDFSAIEMPQEELVYFEAKGFKTREWMRKKKAWAVGGPGKLYIYEGSYKYLKLTETIIPTGEQSEKCTKK